VQEAVTPRRIRMVTLVLGIAAAPAWSQQSPRLLTLRRDALVEAKSRIRSDDARLRPAYDKLLESAQAALVAPLVAVTDKHTLLPPSGDRHDYFSLSPYWWPDPSKPSGLPYIRRDGETNPESKRDLDQPRVAALGDRSLTLALAYYFTGDERYASRAVRQIRTWFLDSATRMNPHLRFAQLVRGVDEERGSGIIDTRSFIETIDGIALIRSSKAWTPADDAGVQRWFRNYLDWLLTSPNGKHEHDAKNNHGSWFAAQTAAFALYVGDTARARQIVEDVKARVGAQITPTGEQPTEMERTRSLHYSSFNIEALSRVAEMGRLLGIDLWRYQAPEGGSLRKAIDRVAEFAVDQRKWPGQQIDSVSIELLIVHLRRANRAFGDTKYAAVLNKLPRSVIDSDRSALLYPDKR
jgi:hypothetical protein